MAKRKPIAASRKPKDQVNMKAIYWSVSVGLFFIISMTLLLILDK